MGRVLLRRCFTIIGRESEGPHSKADPHARMITIGPDEIRALIEI